MTCIVRILLFCIGMFAFTGARTANSSCCSSNGCFNNFTTFGDSYTDIGNAPGPGNNCPLGESGQYAPDTTPGSKLWVQGVADGLCLIITASSQGGTDYALSSLTADVFSQVQSYIAFPNAPVCNNLFAVRPVLGPFLNYLFYNSGVVTPVFNPQLIAQQVDNTVGALTALHNAGACYIILPNMINLGTLPGFTQGFATTSASPQLATQTALAFNEALLEATNALCFDVLQVDAFGLEKEVFANPACFGFTDTSSPCANCAGTAVNCTGFYYWDQWDPTGAVHQLFAEYVLSILNGPKCFANLSEMPLEALFAHNMTIKQHLAPVHPAPIQDKPYVFVGANYSPLLQQPVTTCCPPPHHQKSRNFTVAAGGIYPWNDRDLAGISYGFSQQKSHGSNCCECGLDLHTISGFASHHDDLYYINVLANGSYLHATTERNFKLLKKSTTARGSTHGNQIGITAEGAYYFTQRAWDRLKLGAMADIELNRIKIHGYTEHCAGSANLVYRDRVRYSCITGLGLQSTWSESYWWGDIVVNVFGMAQKDWKTGTHNVKFHVASMPGSHAILPAVRPHFVGGVLGIDMSFAGTRGFVATAGYHAKIGTQKWYDHVLSLDVGWAF